MEKKIWSTPSAQLEQFMANEYVNACWLLACLVPQKSDDVLFGDSKSGSIFGIGGVQDDPFGRDGYGHRTGDGTCGSETSQYIQDHGNSYKITEFHENWLGNIEQLPCWIFNGEYTYNETTQSWNTNEIYDDDNWSLTLSKDKFHQTISEGGYIFWKTQDDYDTYYHYGKAALTSDSENHS